eukprot:gene41459-20994_t
MWAHNPKVLRNPADGEWLLFHITGPPRRRTEDCRGPRGPPGGGELRGPQSQGQPGS